MSQEIKDLLEKEEKDRFLLDILKQQPTAGEFTKELREKYKYAIKEKLCVYAGAYEKVLDRLDRAEEISKDLLPACEMGLNAMRGLLNISDMMKPQWERRDTLISHIKIIEAVIAKAKQ